MWRAEDRESPTVAEGQDEQAFALMRGADIGGGEQIPLRIEPALGQIAKNEGQSASGNKGRHIFQEDECGSYFANTLEESRPDPALVLDAAAGAGGTPRRARKAGCDEIHLSTPASASKGAHIVPDRRRIQGTVRHARHQRAGGIGFPLDVTDGAIVGDEEPDGQVESTNPGTKSHAMESSSTHQGFSRYTNPRQGSLTMRHPSRAIACHSDVG